MRFSRILITSALVHSLCCHVALGAAGGTSLSISSSGVAITLDYEWGDSIYGEARLLHMNKTRDLVYIAKNMDHDNTETDIDLNIAPSEIDDPDLIKVTVLCSERVQQDLSGLQMALAWSLVSDEYYNLWDDDPWEFRIVWADPHKTCIAEPFSPPDCGPDGKSFWFEALKPCNGTTYVYMNYLAAWIVEYEDFDVQAYEVNHNIWDFIGYLPEVCELSPGGCLVYHPADPGFMEDLYRYAEHTLMLRNVAGMTGEVKLSVEFLGEGRVEIYKETSPGSGIRATTPFISEGTTLTWTADISSLVTGTNTKWQEGVWVIPTHLSSVDRDVILKWSFNGETDEIRLTIVPVGVDIDVDSDNNNGTGLPDESAYEDSVEVDDLSVVPPIIVPGKVIPVNDDDDDGDGIIDYLDGFNLTPAIEDDDNAAEDDFYPVVLKLFGDITSATIIQFSYSCAAPDVPANQGRYSTSGGLRIWTKKGARNGNPAWDGGWEFTSGDFVPPTWYYAGELGMLDGYQVFYMEGIQAGVYTIKVEVDMEDDGMWDYEDEVKVTIAKVAVEHPKNKSDVPEYKDAFWCTAPYCFENQAVTSGCPGSTNVRSIEGVVLPATVSYDWSLDTSAGTISPLTGSLTPTHSSPATKGTGTLKLSLVDHPSICDMVEIEIYGDHLERDTTNFLAGNYCTTASDPATGALLATGVQLADGSFVDGLTMVCSTSAYHALTGARGSGTNLRAHTWSSVSSRIHISALMTMQLSRGWVIELLRDDSDNAFLHWQTVKTSGTGANAVTYAGDSSSRIFRHETVGDYFDYYDNKVQQILLSKRYVKIYQP
jgi:hypothetical protein